MILSKSIVPWNLNDRYPNGIVDCTSLVMLGMIELLVKILKYHEHNQETIKSR